MPNVTRGFGLLEPLLSKLRARKADALIPDAARSGRILDVGCGLNPLLLRQVTFAQKFGIDKLTPSGEGATAAAYAVFDVEKSQRFPFRPASFDVVTMLAVLEHLDEALAVSVLEGIHEVLKPGGVLILTTPPPRSNHLLKVMAKVNLVSKEEIDEHQRTYSARQIRGLFRRTSFSNTNLDVGHFELFLNVWARARKTARHD